MDKTILSMDYGEKRIGLALKKRKVYRPEPITGLNNRGDVSLKLLEIIKRHQVDLVLIGLPLDAYEQETSMSQKVRNFYRILRGSVPKTIEMEFFSERNSTQKAWLLYQQNTKKKKSWEHNKDSLAAVVILENYLTEFYKNV